MGNIPILHTQRLLLRPLCLEDAPQIQEKFPHFEIVEFLANTIPWPYPDDGARDFIENAALVSMRNGEAWHWAIFRKSHSEELIGVISLRLGKDNRGFWIAKEHQNQGYASEAAIAVTDYWFNELGQEVLIIPKAKANKASVQVSINSRMRPIREEARHYVGGLMMSQIWEITKAEWQEFRSNKP